MKQNFQNPSLEVLESLIGKDLYRIWHALCLMIEQKYEIEQLWNSGGKKWVYEYKFRRGGKTLCALYAKDNCIGLLVVMGKAERDKFESERDHFSSDLQLYYDQATTYHDGKWIMLELTDTSLLKDIEQLLEIKRKPNRKMTI